MQTRPRQALERWAMRSRSTAFAFLIGLGLIISVGLVGGVTAFARISMPHVVAGVR